MNNIKFKINKMIANYPKLTHKEKTYYIQRLVKDMNRLAAMNPEMSRELLKVSNILLYGNMNNKRKAALINSSQLLSEMVGKPIDPKEYETYIDKLIKTDVRIIACIVIFLISLLYIHNGLNNNEMANAIEILLFVSTFILIYQIFA